VVAERETHTDARALTVCTTLAMSTAQSHAHSHLTSVMDAAHHSSPSLLARYTHCPSPSHSHTHSLTHTHAHPHTHSRALSHTLTRTSLPTLTALRSHPSTRTPQPSSRTPAGRLHCYPSTSVSPLSLRTPSTPLTHPPHYSHLVPTSSPTRLRTPVSSFISPFRSFLSRPS
jgi:hypothetical protein